MKKLLALLTLLALPVGATELSDRVRIPEFRRDTGRPIYVASLAPLASMPALFQIIPGGGGGGTTLTPGSTTFATCTANAIFYNDGTNVFQCNGLLESLSGSTWTLATAVGTNGIFLATAPAATTGASQAGKTIGITASAAVASTDTAGAAAGGAVTITGGAAARNTSGNANGGNVVVVGGAGIGTGTTGTFDFSGALQAVGPVGSGTVPSYSFTGATNYGIFYNSNNIYFTHAGSNTALISASEFRLRSDAAFTISSATNPTTAADTFLSRSSAATWQLGAADVNGTPVDQTLRSQGAITGADKPGGQLNIKPGIGTGAGAGKATVQIYRGLMAGAGTGAQTYGAAHVACQSKTLSNTTGTATALANFTLPNNSSGAARATVSVQCNDGTNFDADVVTTYVAFVNKAGTITVGTPVTTASAAANNSGSCTIAPTWVANGTTSIDFKVTPVITTIAPSTTTGFVNIEYFGSGTVACQ